MEKAPIAIIVGVIIGLLVLLSSIVQPMEIISPAVVQDGIVQVVIGGASNASLISQVPNRMPWFDRTVDVLIAPTLTKQGVQGFASLMSRYRIGLVILPRMYPADEESRAFIRTILARHIPYRFATYGEQLVVKDFSIRFLAPVANISSVIVRVDDKKLSFLSAFPKGVSGKTFRSIGIPEDALNVSVPSLSSHTDTYFTFLADKWFMKCENETDLPFLQHVCTNRSWQSNEHL